MQDRGTDVTVTPSSSWFSEVRQESFTWIIFSQGNKNFIIKKQKKQKKNLVQNIVCHSYGHNSVAPRGVSVSSVLYITNSWSSPHLWGCAELNKNNSGQNSRLFADIRKHIHQQLPQQQQQEVFWLSVSRVQVPHVFLKCLQPGIDLGQVSASVHRGVPGYRRNISRLFIQHYLLHSIKTSSISQCLTVVFQYISWSAA